MKTMANEKGRPARKLTRRELSKGWRRPRFEFHNETTGWYEIAHVGDLSLMVRCTQACRIEFFGGTLGYDVAIPGSYELFAELDQETCWGFENLARAQVAFEDVASPADLKRRALDWLVSGFPSEFDPNILCELSHCFRKEAA